MVNITEICVANGTGILLCAFLMAIRIKRTSKAQLTDKLFSCMLLVTIVSTLCELIAFLLDGRPGTLNNVLLWISNLITLVGAPIVSYLWYIYVEYKLHRNFKRLKLRAICFSFPVFAVILINVSDCLFKTSLIFSINESNMYTRGLIIAVPFSVLALYFFASVINYLLTNARSSERQFFPVVSFLLPCFMGMLIQAFIYGIAVGWLGVSIAFMFVYIQLQTKTTFVDELSGLFNRRYMEQFVSGFSPREKYPSLYGIMIDVNGFKKINDTYGHTMGDDAIVNLGRILSESADIDDVVTRFAGDEFIILSRCDGEDSVKNLFARINQKVASFNETTAKPYKLYLAMGYGKYRPNEETVDEFLKKIDDAMYSAKESFYKRRENERRG